MTETTVDAHLLHTLKVLTDLGLHVVRQNLRVLAGSEVLLPVQEPAGDLELLGSLEDVDDTLKLIRVKLTSTVALVSTKGRSPPWPRERTPTSRKLCATARRRAPLPSWPWQSCCYNVPLVKINVGLLANDVGVTATDTLDLRQGVHDLPLAVNVGVKQTDTVSTLFTIPARC